VILTDKSLLNNKIFSAILHDLSSEVFNSNLMFMTKV